MGRGRSKQMGAPVEDLTKSELLSEKSRCENKIKLEMDGHGGHAKRLRKIEKRLDFLEEAEACKHPIEQAFDDMMRLRF